MIGDSILQPTTGAHSRLKGKNKCAGQISYTATLRDSVGRCKFKGEPNPDLQVWGCQHTPDTLNADEVPAALRYILGYDQQTSAKVFITGEIELQDLRDRMHFFMTVI